MTQSSLDDDLANALWDERYWKKFSYPPFHLQFIHPMLEKFSGKLFEGEKRGRVFLPLCGKSLDLLYLADKGHEVVGVEFSKIAVDSFFNENNLTFAESKVENQPFAIYEAKEKKITIYRGDIYAITSNVIGKFDGVWDRGSFQAISVSKRQAYSVIIKEILKPGARILVEVSDYDIACNGGDKGFPYAVLEEDILKFFGADFEVEVLDVSEKKPPPHFNPDLKFYMRTMSLTSKTEK